MFWNKVDKDYNIGKTCTWANLTRCTVTDLPCVTVIDHRGLPMVSRRREVWGAVLLIINVCKRYLFFISKTLFDIKIGFFIFKKKKKKKSNLWYQKKGICDTGRIWSTGWNIEASVAFLKCFSIFCDITIAVNFYIKNRICDKKKKSNLWYHKITFDWNLLVVLSNYQTVGTPCFECLSLVLENDMHIL